MNAFSGHHKKFVPLVAVLDETIDRLDDIDREVILELLSRPSLLPVDEVYGYTKQRAGESVRRLLDILQTKGFKLSQDELWGILATSGPIKPPEVSLNEIMRAIFK